MKKKIIYFCAGVLLTSLILVAIQTYATAPNPGHNISQLSGDLNAMTLSGKSLITMLPVLATDYFQVAKSGTCPATCISLGAECIASMANTGTWYTDCVWADTYLTTTTCRCGCLGCYKPFYR